MEKTPLIIIVFIILAVIIFWKPIRTNIKALFLITQEFPQITIKPLHLITPIPKKVYIEFGEKDKIKGDLAIPKTRGRYPALILAMGVRTREQDKPVILSFADTLARLGYVAMWPRSEAIDREEIRFEDPNVFIESFNYVKGRSDVNPNRISFVGFSVGSSLAMVAAQDQAINNNVHGFVFFGGYYNLVDYLKALATSKVTIDDQEVAWQPASDALQHAEQVLQSEGITLETFKNEVPKNTERKLGRLSPNTNISQFKSRPFILHDENDSYVPRVESQKLKDAICNRIDCTYHLSNVLEHAKAGGEGITRETITEFWRLYVFLYKTLNYL